MNVALQARPVAQVAMTAIESSQIAEIGHCVASSTLAILFKSKTGGAGSLYHYDNVTAEDFAAFSGAESIGSHFYKHIKPFAEKYPYRKIETPIASLTDLADSSDMDDLFPTDSELLLEIREMCSKVFGLSYDQTDARMAVFDYKVAVQAAQ